MLDDINHPVRANVNATSYSPGFMSPERLSIKRVHALRHPDGRTAELVGHIDAQEQQIAELIAEVNRLIEMYLKN